MQTERRTDDVTSPKCVPPIHFSQITHNTSYPHSKTKLTVCKTSVNIFCKRKKVEYVGFEKFVRN
jgi:hypothetical protein